MRRIFCTLIALLYLHTGFAQNARIAGSVIEASTKEPMEFVNVNLYKISDSLLLTGTVTNKDGQYAIQEIPPGHYYLEISFIGFKNVRVPSFELKSAMLRQMAQVQIEPSENILGEINITEEKSTYESGIDRKIFNVEKDIQSVSGTASTILENVPSVSVDIDGNVSLHGSGNVTILINGKPSPMMRTNAATALQQIPANTIERIEIITNPSAKYKPDGTAGIINIVLKKNTKQGLNGTLTLNAGNDNRYNGTLLMNYKPGKFNYFGSYGYRYDNRSRWATDLRTVFDSAGNKESAQDLYRSSDSRSQSHTATLGFDYEPDTMNSFGLSGYFEYYDLNREENTSTLLTDPADNVTSDYQRERINPEFEWDLSLESFFTHKFKKKDRELNFELTAADHYQEEVNENTTRYLVPVIPETKDNTLILQWEKQAEFLAEYISPVGEDKELEAGYSFEYIGQEFDFSGETFNTATNDWVKDTVHSQRFNFRQIIHAAYTTYSFDLGDIGVMAGVRAEQALITSHLITIDSTVPNNYFKLYPSLHLSLEIANGHELMLSYSPRVNRPEGDELNPFPEYTDPRNIEAGNPLLKPEQVHAVEFGYQFKNKTLSFLPTLYYKYTYDAFTEVSTYINDTVLLTSFDNLSNDQSTGLELVLTTRIKKLMNINLSGNLYYNQIDASNLGFLENKSTWTWNAKLALGIAAWKHGTIQLNPSYRSAQLTPQGENLPMFVMDGGLRQDVFKEKASLVLSVSDIFNTRKWSTRIDTPELQQTFTSKRRSQIIYFGFSWRFGKVLKKDEVLKFDDKM